MVYRPKVDAKLCFVALPLSKPFTDYFAGIMQPAAADAGLTAKTSAQVYGTGPIIQDIWDHIWSAAVVAADVTGKNPNVNYELGLCHAIGVPTIIISQEIDDVPFDYRHRRCILYDTTDVDWQSRLRKGIGETIATVLSGDPYQDELRWPYDTVVLREAKRIGIFVSSQDATADVMSGARLVRDPVARSFGPHGVSISMRVSGQERRLRSGVAVASNTWSQNRFEAAGIVAMRQVANMTRDRIGDGSKLAIILADEFIERGYAALKEGYLPRDVVHGMDTAVEKTIAFVKGQSKAVTEPDLFSAARTAAVGDEHVATLVCEAMKKAGKDGVITIESRSSPEDAVEVVEGMQFDRGYLDERFVTEESKAEAVLDDAYVLICDQKLSSMKDMLPVLEQVARVGKPLLIIAEDVEGEALATLRVNKERGTLRVAPVKSPGFGDRRKALLEDIAILTGGTVVSRESGLSIQGLSLSQLGRAKRITVTRDNTYIGGGAGSPEAVNARVQAIRNRIASTVSDIDREKLHERLSKLGGAVSTIIVGSDGDSETRLYRATNAMFASRAAVESGTVPGGGSTLWHSRQALLSLDESDAGKKAGIDVIASALGIPLELQVANAKANIRDVRAALDADKSTSIGFNAVTRRVEDLYKSGVIDATDVIVNAARVAFTQARAVLQTGAWGEEEGGELEGKAPVATS
jgi:chaperonin GroEL